MPVHGPEGVRSVVDGFNQAYALDRRYRVAHHGPDLVGQPRRIGPAARGGLNMLSPLMVGLYIFVLALFVGFEVRGRVAGFMAFCYGQPQINWSVDHQLLIKLLATSLEVFGCRFIQAYGLTETSPTVCINPFDAETFSGSIGLPVSSTECCIKSEDGEVVGVDELGELPVGEERLHLLVAGKEFRNPFFHDTCRLLSVPFAELVNTTGCIKQFLLSGKKGMTLRTNFHPNIQ